ncbi:predicted protein [Naegleria gruberi]|uniref:2'-phosphotransferase n=1 Tax=Naegleria gruberi TaxID=5762 RepID=D2VFN4_NAEGR|nr:uncharacterized protein NAEGRDRAFT_49152 [Naegleria gruberi]EFC44388.1 predicted protein [Naegleria gruberi]|eukprot:XP_002677132.1 predicted protein [Naegleria gruberi strain NEG-M]
MNFQAIHQSSSSSTSSGSSSEKKRGGRREMGETEKVSRALSKLLRHKADKTKGINLRADGYVLIREILALKDFKGVTQQMIEECVKNNDKQRFNMTQDATTGEYIIRANQGHTIAVEVEMEEIDSPSKLGEYANTVMHGTYHDAYDKIVQSGGLSRMSRQHIHFAIGEPEEGHVISGMRKSAEVCFFLDVQKTIDEGIKLLKSSNGVILSPGNDKGLIPMHCFSQIIDRKTRKVLYTNKP